MTPLPDTIHTKRSVYSDQKRAPQAEEARKTEPRAQPPSHGHMKNLKPL